MSTLTSTINPKADLIPNLGASIRAAESVGRLGFAGSSQLTGSADPEREIPSALRHLQVAVESLHGETYALLEALAPVLSRETEAASGISGDPVQSDDAPLAEKLRCCGYDLTCLTRNIQAVRKRLQL